MMRFSSAYLTSKASMLELKHFMPVNFKLMLNLHPQIILAYFDLFLA